MATSKHYLLLTAMTLACCLWSPEFCPGDLIRLKSGGELRGKLLSDLREEPREISLRTVTGSLVHVKREQVDFITRRSLSYEEYELKARLTPQTAADQWALAEWCRTERMSTQRDLHLEKVLELDPENEAAHKALGHLFREGSWTTRDEYMTAQGYVLHEGRYITPEEKLLLESNEAERERQRDWYPKVRLWTGWLTSRSEKQQQALQNFAAIQDPDAIPALQNFLASEPQRDYRLLYIQTLSQISSPAAITGLVKMTVLDSDQGVRLRALEKISQEQAAHATSQLVPYLQNGDNLVVRRTGTALKHLGDQQAVPHLIEALVTNHRYRVPVDVPTVGVAIGPGGRVTGGSPMAGYPPELQAAVAAGILSPDSITPPSSLKQLVTVRVDQQNPEVLEALQEITEADFGYDERTWKLWWLAKNS